MGDFFGGKVKDPPKSDYEIKAEKDAKDRIKKEEETAAEALRQRKLNRAGARSLFAEENQGAGFFKVKST